MSFLLQFFASKNFIKTINILQPFQQVTLPSYEEALRESNSNGNALPEYDNPLANGTANGMVNGMSNGIAANGISNGMMTHPQPQQQQQQHFRFHANGRVSRTAHPIGANGVANGMANGMANGAHHGRRSRHPAGTGGGGGGGGGGLGRFAAAAAVTENVDSMSHHSAQATYPATLQQHR